MIMNIIILKLKVILFRNSFIQKMKSENIINNINNSNNNIKKEILNEEIFQQS